jgi:hypothetical protein
MKIFPKEAMSAESTPVKDKTLSKGEIGISHKKRVLPAKKNISPSEIREKLAARVETSEAAKNLALKNNSKKMGAGFLNDEFKPESQAKAAPNASEKSVEESEKEDNAPSGKDFVLKSDIAKNDPKDTNTQEKLKMVISKGGFNFNPKERDVLEKILADN